MNQLKPSVLVGDSGSNLDYSGGRKTHRFPPPYGLGSLSLTHRPTENPTGVTKRNNPLRETPHPGLPQSGEGDEPHPSAGDSGSNLDYSGGRKAHRFPPPYGLGSLSLTIALPKIQPV